MLKILRTVFVFVTVLAAAQSSAHAQTLDSTAAGRIEFQSYTPKTMFDLARENRQNWTEQKVWGDLRFPSKASQKVPAIVLSHGSGGVDPEAMSQWVNALNDIGVATFVVDSFVPRGVKRTAADQTLVPPGANLVDAFRALELLATHPRIDASRIGIMGFSRGGEVAFRSALLPMLRSVVKSDLKFALHIPVYAGCNQVYWSNKLTKAPMLNLVGAADDYTHPEPCEELAQRYAAAGVQIRTVKYADAHHGWDGIRPVRYVSDVTSAYSCGVITWNIEPWAIKSERTGQTIGVEGLGALMNSDCVKRGAHVGRNEAAYQQSRKDVQEFVSSVFFAGM